MEPAIKAIEASHAMFHVHRLSARYAAQPQIPDRLLFVRVQALDEPEPADLLDGIASKGQRALAGVFVPALRIGHRDQPWDTIEQLPQLAFALDLMLRVDIGRGVPPLERWIRSAVDAARGAGAEDLGEAAVADLGRRFRRSGIDLIDAAGG